MALAKSDLSTGNKMILYIPFYSYSKYPTMDHQLYPKDIEKTDLKSTESIERYVNWLIQGAIEYVKNVFKLN